MIIKTKGAEAFYNGKMYQMEGVDVAVVETFGSGAAFLAAFIHFYFKEKDIESCLNKGAKLRAFVATKLGAVP